MPPIWPLLLNSGCASKIASLYPCPKWPPSQKKDVRSISDVDWAGKLISEGSGGSGIKTEQDIDRFIFHGELFFLFYFFGLV